MARAGEQTGRTRMTILRSRVLVALVLVATHAMVASLSL